MSAPSCDRHTRAYRMLTWLYPGDLRAEHGAEMVQVFGDLIRERGRRAWTRTMVDLAVSLPRTHMEVIMSTAWSRTALLTALTIVAALAVVGVLTLGVAAIPAAIVLVAVAVAQRSRLARAVDGGPGARSRAALVVLTCSALLLTGTVVSWFWGIERGYSFPDGVLLAYNLLGFGSLAGIVSSAIVLVKRGRKPQVGT